MGSVEFFILYYFFSCCVVMNKADDSFVCVFQVPVHMKVLETSHLVNMETFPSRMSEG